MARDTPVGAGIGVLLIYKDHLPHVQTDIVAGCGATRWSPGAPARADAALGAQRRGERGQLDLPPTTVTFGALDLGTVGHPSQSRR